MDMPEYSYWIIAGLALMIAEFAVSGLVVIFFGIAALLVGSLKFLGLIDDTTWELTIFAVTSLLLLVFVRRVLN
ncbi:NfeD family protein, partial [Alcanivorax sp. HI0083]